MSATVTFQRYQTVEYTLTRTTTGDPVTIAFMDNTVASTSPVTIIDGGRMFCHLGATATDTADLWPASIAALASGTAIHFRIQIAYGSTDTTANARKVSLTSGGGILTAMFTYGSPLEFDFTTATSLQAKRINTANEQAVIEVLWYVYTI